MRRWIAALALVGLVLVSCDSEPEAEMLRPRGPVSSPTSRDTRVIALVGTLSGPDEWRGEDAFEGADLAVSELNQEVDEGRPGFELVTRDDRGDPATAVRLVQELAGLGRTIGIVYAGPTESVPSMETALAEAGIPLLLCYGDLYSGRLLRPHLFQVSPPYLWQARAMARYIERDRGYRRIGALVSRSLSGSVALESLRTALEEQGLRPPRVVRYRNAGEVDWRLRRFKPGRIEAIVVEGTGTVVDEAVFSMRQMKARYLTTAKARRGRIAARGRWNPQIFAFDAAIAPGRVGRRYNGTVAADTYARGAHYLPIPSMKRFRASFGEWWGGDSPLGWELRGYEAARAIGWASRNARPGADLALVLENLDGERFGGIGITFGPDDHTAVDQAAVGLWVVPRDRFDPPSAELPWLPLARGFSFDGQTTAISSDDWRYLFRDPPPRDGPPPKVRRMRYAVNSPSSDPVH